MSVFNFELNQPVEIDASGERGRVIARAQYVNGLETYYVRYRCADGRAVEQWWDVDALSAVEPVEGQGAAE